MIEWFDWLNLKNGAVIAILTLVLAVFNGLVVWFGWRQYRDASKPEVIAYLIPDPDDIPCVQLIIANIGLVAAKNIAVHTSLPDDLAFRIQIRIPGLNGVERIAALLPKDKVVFRLGPGHKILSVQELRSFGMTVRFEGYSDRKQFVRSYSISVEDWQRYQWNRIEAKHPLAESIIALKDPLLRIAEILDRDNKL